MATTTEGFITSSDGTRLFFRRHAAAAPKARILVIHGFAEHGGRYLELLDALAEEQKKLALAKQEAGQIINNARDRAKTVTADIAAARSCGRQSRQAKRSAVP